MSGVLNFTCLYELIDAVNRMSEEGAWMYVMSEQEVQDEIIRLNQEQLYDYGIDAKGRELENSENPLTGPGEYARYTIEHSKLPFGLPYDRITLYQTGKFYASFYVRFDGVSFEVMADANKPDGNLYDMFGTDITGLTQFNLIEKLKPILLPFYADYIAKNLLYGGR